MSNVGYSGKYFYQITQPNIGLSTLSHEVSIGVYGHSFIEVSIKILQEVTPGEMGCLAAIVLPTGSTEKVVKVLPFPSFTCLTGL